MFTCEILHLFFLIKDLSSLLQLHEVPFCNKAKLNAKVEEKTSSRTSTEAVIWRDWAVCTVYGGPFKRFRMDLDPAQHPSIPLLI